MKIHVCAAALVCAVSACFADIPPPPPTGRPATLEVHQEESSAVRLLIPSNLAPVTAPPPTSSPDKDNERIRGAIAGVLLSLSIVVAGILLVRWRQSQPIRMALVFSTLALMGTGLTLADMLPPHKPYFIPNRNREPIPVPKPTVSNFEPGTLAKIGKAVSYTHGLSGQVSVEIVPEGSPITLIIPGLASLASAYANFMPLVLFGTMLCAAGLAAAAPAPMSVWAAFLFAGPHNWMEARYFLARMPVRWGRSRAFFTVAIAGVILLSFGWARLVRTMLAAGGAAVVLLWICLAVDYATVREAYFTVAIAHVLAEAPFLIRLL
jgi:hypothetical protein